MLIFIWPPSAKDENISFSDRGESSIDLNAVYVIDKIFRNSEKIHLTPKLKETITFYAQPNLQFYYPGGGIVNSAESENSNLLFRGYVCDPMKEILRLFSKSSNWNFLPCRECKKGQKYGYMRYCLRCAAYFGEMWKFKLPSEVVKEVEEKREHLLDLTLPSALQITWTVETKSKPVFYSSFLVLKHVTFLLLDNLFEA